MYWWRARGPSGHWSDGLHRCRFAARVIAADRTRGVVTGILTACLVGARLIGYATAA